MNAGDNTSIDYPRLVAILRTGQRPPIELIERAVIEGGGSWYRLAQDVFAGKDKPLVSGDPCECGGAFFISTSKPIGEGTRRTRLQCDRCGKVHIVHAIDTARPRRRRKST